MDRLHDLSPELDSLGLELPFSERPEPEAEFEMLGPDLLDETPFAEVPAGEGPLFEAPNPEVLEFEQEAGTRHQFKDCTPAEKKLLIDAADRAVHAVRHAAGFVGGAHGNPGRMSAATRQLLNTHFHTVRQRDLRVILTRLQRIAMALDDGVKFSARRKCDAGPGWAHCGYAKTSQWFGGFGRVEICFDTRPNHCNAAMLPSDQQAALVIHEVAHRYVGIDDKAAFSRPADYARLSAGAALDNADSYAFFAVQAISTLSEAELEQAGEVGWSTEEFEWTGEQFEWLGEEESSEDARNFEQDQGEIDRLLQAGDWRGAVKAAIQGGERDKGKLTNLIFFFRHPELDRTRPLQPKTSKADAALAKEWETISRTEVWPAIVDFAKDSVLAVDGKQIAGRIAQFRGKAGKRFKQLIEAAAQKVGLNPGLIAAVLVAEIGTRSEYLSPNKVRSYRVGVDDFYIMQADLQNAVPAYAKIRWDKTQTPEVHWNDAKKPRLVKTILFDSGPDGLLATAVYLKYGEVRLRAVAKALGGDFDTLPVETRFALTRMTMANRVKAKERLAAALKGEDILVRNWAAPKIYVTERNATIRAAEAMFLSGWVFGQPLTPRPPVRPQPEQLEPNEAERFYTAPWEREEFADSEENEELAWLAYESGGAELFEEEEEAEGFGEESLEPGFREAEWGETDSFESSEAEFFDPEGPGTSQQVPETPDIHAGEGSNAGPSVLEAEAATSRVSTITASVGAGGVNRRADVLHVQAAIVIRARQDRVEVIKIDGIVGPKTIAAITDYQRRKALIVDGRVDTGGPTIRLLEDGLIATAAVQIGAEIAAILNRARHAVLHDAVSAGMKEAYRRALGIALALRGRQSPAGFAAAPVLAAVAAAPAAALGVLEMMMLALLAAFAMLVIIQSLPRMGKSVEELIRKIQLLIAEFLDGIKAHIDSVEDLVRRNTQAGMRCSAELLLFRSLSAQLLAALSAPRQANPIDEQRRTIRIANLFNQWKGALAALFRCLDDEPPVAAFGEVDPAFRETAWAEADSFGPAEAEEESEDSERFSEALYGDSGEEESADTLQALSGPEVGPVETADPLKDLTALIAGPTLRRGSTGPAVKSLQCALVRLGNSALGIDGRFGPATELAVRQFQKFSGLGFDGIVGPNTKGALALALGGKKKKAAPKGPPNGQVDLAGFFVWDPAITDAQEKQALFDGKWHPATVDFLAVMGSGTNQGMGNLPAVLGEIVKWPKGTVKRVNFMTHSNGRILGITGKNILGNVTFDVSVTDQDIDNLAMAGMSFTVPGRPSFTIQDVRDRFAPDAVFVIYGCKSGLNTSVLTALNRLLGIKIVSFKKEIVFCPPTQNKPNFVRKGMKIGINKQGFSCSTDSTPNWRGLISHPDVVSVP